MRKGPAPQGTGTLRTLTLVGLGRLQIRGGELAALGHDVVADLLAFTEAGHAGLLDGRDVDEHVIAAVNRSDEAEALLRIEEFYDTCRHCWLLFKIRRGNSRETRAGERFRQKPFPNSALTW